MVGGTRDSSPGPGTGAAEVSLSVEESNKLRISLGLKPLEDGPSETKEQEAEKRFEDHRKKQAEEARAGEVRERIERTRNQQKLREKLAGKGLGEADDAEDDVLLDPRKWVSRQRKRDKEKELAAKRARDLEEQDRQAAEAGEAIQAKYTSQDLAGIRISHDLGDFVEGEEKILTLKDTSVLNEDGDELVSVQISEAEHARKNIENKRARKAYTAYDDDEFTEMGAPRKRAILSQYDEEEKAGFILGDKGLYTVQSKGRASDPLSSTVAGGAPRSGADRLTVEQKLRSQYLTNDSVRQQQSDYYTPEEMAVTFKKSKKKRKSRKRTGQDEDEIISEPSAALDAMYAEGNGSATLVAPPARTIAEDQSFVDDEDLQAALARSRRLKSKKLVRSSVEHVAKTVLGLESAQQGKDAEDEDEDDDKRIVLSDATEFVRTLSSQPILMRTEASVATKVIEGQAAMEEDLRWRQQDPEEVVGDVEMQDAEHGDVEAEDEYGEENGGHVKPIEEEPLVSGGLAATLALLKQKGFVRDTTAQQDDERAKVSYDRAKWLAEAKKRDRELEAERRREKELDRELERTRVEEKRRGYSGGLDDWEREARDRERERQNEYRERQWAREIQDRFANYKPDINLDHYDDQGNKLNEKEAFRYLSHKFHGKHSGKMKTEKRMQKLAEKKKLEAMASNDTPLHLASTLLEQQKAAGTAHVVLTVGNRGAVPADAPLAGVVRGSMKTKGNTPRTVRS